MEKGEPRNQRRCSGARRMRLVVVFAVACTLLKWCAAGDIPLDWRAREAAAALFPTTSEPEEQQNYPVIGNGFVGTLINSNGTYINGVYSGRRGSTPSHRARIPSSLIINVTNVAYNASALALDEAMFLRRFESANGSARAEQRWYAHRAFRPVMVHELHLEAVEQTTFELSWSYPFTDGECMDCIPNGVSGDIHFAIQPSTLDDAVLTYGFINETETLTSENVSVAVCTSKIPSSITLAAGQQRTVYFFTAFASSLDSDDPLSMARFYFLEAQQTPPALMRKLHVELWAELWRSNIAVQGNLTLAQSINASLYEVLSNVRSDWPFGVSPGGAATNSYNGHVFWDMETWMYPSLLLLHRGLAKSFLEYRFNRMAAAERKAREHGLEGTMFPWESAFTGAECTPWNDGQNPEGELELHIIADIALAVHQYYKATGDQHWLREVGFPIMEQCAKFWVRRVTFNTESEQYEIWNVQPPDESAGRVNNSVYTNAAVASMLLDTVTANVVQEVGASWNEVSSGLRGIQEPCINKTTIDDPDCWMEVALHMYIPFDDELQIHPEYDGYDGEHINQADVALLQYPLQFTMPAEIAYNDLVYYEGVTRENGYFTGNNAYSVAWLRLGHEYAGNALRYYESSFRHIQGPFHVWWEKLVGGHSHFLTGAGGFLQNIVFGYMGLNIQEHALGINPLLPPGVEKLTLARISYQQVVLAIEFDGVSARIELEDPGENEWLCVTDATGNVNSVHDSIVIEDLPATVAVQTGPFCDATS